MDQARILCGASLQGAGLATPLPLFRPGAGEGDAPAPPGGQPPPDPLPYPVAEAASSPPGHQAVAALARAHPDMNIDGRLDAGNALI